MKSHYLLAGDIFVASEPTKVTTVLGSCVSVCLWDERRKTGGINHFKAPMSIPGKPADDRFGDVAMQNLISSMLWDGSRIKDLRAVVIGGGEIMSWVSQYSNFATRNIEVAHHFLDANKILVIKSFTGEDHGRRVEFNTYTGEVSITPVQNRFCMPSKPSENAR